ncbi:hypothetical protein PAXRUDRAFT_126711, partial [Paxillus rubicundulus Ve08.2h10]
IQSLGHMLTAAYTYDNFDVDLKSTVHMVEKSSDSLKHLTFGLLFPLLHGIKQQDMWHSQLLWEK